MMRAVRITITLDVDVADLVQRLMRERKLSFTEAVNLAVRRGLGSQTVATDPTPTFSMGEPAVPVTPALRLAADIESEAIIRKLAFGQ